MKHEKIYREIFLNNTIRIVAEGGFEKATTRAIAQDRKAVEHVKMNEAYIYSIFKSKEGLFSDVFGYLEDGLINLVINELSSVDASKDVYSEYLAAFKRIWGCLLTKKDECKYCAQYYYSAYYNKEAQAAHAKRIARLVNELSPFFKKDADVRSLLEHCITVTLDFIIRTFNGDVENSEQNVEYIFNLLSSSITLYVEKPTQKI